MSDDLSLAVPAPYGVLSHSVLVPYEVLCRGCLAVLRVAGTWTAVKCARCGRIKVLALSAGMRVSAK